MTGGDMVLADFCQRAGLGDPPSLIEVVEAIRAIPYGRPAARSAGGTVAEWLGTCSTKHALLARYVGQRWPELGIRLVHRVYRLTPEAARAAFGEDVFRSVPDDGLTDVHTFATIQLDGQQIQLDVTFCGEPWDGRTGMALACAAGEDYDGSVDPWPLKASLVERHCDPDARDRFIAALAGQAPRQDVRSDSP